MNKKGADQNMMRTLISLFLMIGSLAIITTIYFKVSPIESCPGGYSLIANHTNSEVTNFCGSADEMEAFGYSCCSRNTNANEFCRYDTELKEFSRCIDLGSFDEVYKHFGFTCKDTTPCGTAKLDRSCAGVSCPSGKLCTIQKIEGVNIGECVSEFVLNGENVKVKEDGVTLCGQISPEGFVGVECNEEEKRRGFGHCVVDGSAKISRCTGVI
jgi:hypothetical protein